MRPVLTIETRADRVADPETVALVVVGALMRAGYLTAEVGVQWRPSPARGRVGAEVRPPKAEWR